MVGWISASLIVLTRVFDIEITYYLWLIGFILTGLLILSFSPAGKTKQNSKEQATIRLPEIIKLFRDHSILIWMSGFVILINFLGINIIIQTSENFKNMTGNNLDMLYAGTGLTIAIFGTIVSRIFFKKTIKAFGLPNTMVGATFGIGVLILIYLFTRNDILAWIQTCLFGCYSFQHSYQ